MADQPLAILRDPRVRRLPWRDLTRLSPSERVWELCLPFPWLGLEFWLAAEGHPVAAAAAAAMFFLAGLRLAHDAFHDNLGLGRRAHDLVLVALSALMLCAMHAIRSTHRRHHVHCLDDDDDEGASARLTALGALLRGPALAVRTHRAGFTHAPAAWRRWIGLEAAATALVAGLGAAGALGTPAAIHVGLMLAGQCLAPFFAVWTVHHGCDRSHFIARTLRNRLKSALVLGMFYHLEHHLFPRVPTRRLPELARRLDRVAPELSSRQVY